MGGPVNIQCTHLLATAFPAGDDYENELESGDNHEDELESSDKPL